MAFQLKSPGETLILVVDDLPRNVQVAGVILHEAGYDIIPCDGGMKALELAEAERPDLILLDLMMPEMDGFETCRRLKENEGTRPIPVIFFTAADESEKVVQAFELGAVDYVTKPFRPAELLARVKIHLELKQARDKLTRVSEEKSRFISMAAHDLNSPLCGVLMNLDLLEAIFEIDALPPAARKAIADMQRLSHRMVRLIRSLLNVAAIEQGRWQYEPKELDLGKLLDESVEGLRLSAQRKKIQLLVDCRARPALVKGDSDALLQIMDNLISNALKFSPTGSTVQLTVERQDGRVRLMVWDEGPGLSRADRERLFGRFSRLSAKPTAGENSTGLGLSIVKHLVEGMGGKVWCSGEDVKGAQFVVEFEAAR